MKKKFKIEGMTCASCVIINEDCINELNGVSDVKVNLATNIASIEYDESLISFEEIAEEVASNGFKVNESFSPGGKDAGKADRGILKRFILSAIFSLPVFSMMFGDFGLGVKYFGADLIMYFYSILSFIVVFVFGGHFHKSAYTSLKNMHFTMDSLVSLGTLTAFIYSIIAMFFPATPVYFEAAVAIITLINLGKYLEYRAKTKAGDAIGKLLELGAKKATIIVGIKEIEKDIEDIKVGDIIIVKAGQKIALDGVILSGSANIDESMLTGESIPVFKEKGGECFGGTINLDGNVQIKVTKNSSEGTLANIIKLVDDAQSSKAPIQHLADKVSGIFVPVIIGISLVTFVSWYLFSGNISEAIIAAVATLVIACPCALGLATPTAIMVGTGVGAKNGILIKNAETLEKSKDIDVIVFDKTGTLTKGEPEVTDVLALDRELGDLLLFAKSLAEQSHHPLSRGIIKYDGDFIAERVEDFKEIKGKGVTGIIDGKKIKMGNKKLFGKLSSEAEANIEELTLLGKTPIIVGTESEIFGIIGLLDVAKIGVERTIDNLHSMNIKTVMLTGDTKNTANFIAEQIGIEEVIAEVMPEDKLELIKKLQSEKNRVAFVGDGINDAPALTQSDLSIAMGTGSDIAIESSDIVLVKGNLEKVVSAISLSRQTLRVIKQNLFWAFVYNTIGIPLAAFGILNPIFASFAMSMSSVSVISNSLRLKLFK